MIHLLSARKMARSPPFLNVQFLIFFFLFMFRILAGQRHTGCYYMFQHYSEGDRIITNEPCLNCTCHDSMLMCFLKVCPFAKPIGQDCQIEKRPDQCCPIITCPERKCWPIAKIISSFLFFFFHFFNGVGNKKKKKKKMESSLIPPF